MLALFYHRSDGGSLEVRRNGFNAPEVGELATEFSCVQLDYQAAKEKATELGVTAVPCIVYLDQRGEPFMTTQGFGTPARLAAEMRRALTAFRSGRSEGENGVSAE